MQQPLLSVALPIYNQHDQIEQTLTGLYECSKVPLELILIDDASTDDSQEVIHSVLDYYQHDRTFFFEHNQHWGRGNTLNEALQHISAPYLWIPGAVEEIHENVLLETLDQLSQQQTAGAYMGFDPLPETIEQWLGLLEADVLPTDDLFIWQLPHIPMPELFFNPYMTVHHGAELAIRLQYHHSLSSTDPFFALSQDEDLPQPDRQIISEFIYTMLRRPDLADPQQQQLMGILQAFHEQETSLSSSIDVDLEAHGAENLDQLFSQARKYFQDGEISSALELLSHILEEDPSHEEARLLKIQLLERQRRYVEASELKHQPRSSTPETPTSNQDEPSMSPVDLPDRTEDAVEDHQVDSVSESDQNEDPIEEDIPVDIRTSIIIPTTADSKPLLEACLINLSEHVDPATTQLIIVDNASLDDTFEYLNQLKEDNFYHIEVLTHAQNVGFARSINEGIKLAEGRYICAMHSDVMLESDVPGALADLLEDDGYHEVGLIAPLASKTLNPQQEAEEASDEEELVEVDYVDSFMMLWRADLELTFDEQYGAAYFDDLDFCLQVQQQGARIAVAPGQWVDHFEQTITRELGLTPNSRAYWENSAYFNNKWSIPAKFPKVADSTKDWEKLCILGELINPYAPEEAFVELFNEWYTSEAKAKMLSPDRTLDEQVALAHLMMTMDQRDTLRHLEDEMEREELPVDLIHRLVEYYFERHIYSRCKHYLELLEPENRPIELYISQLKIAVSEREMDLAVDLLGMLMDAAPVHPSLLELAGEIHHFKGNTEEAGQFFDLAQQLYPNSIRPNEEVVQNDYVG